MNINDFFETTAYLWHFFLLLCASLTFVVEILKPNFTRLFHKVSGIIF